MTRIDEHGRPLFSADGPEPTLTLEEGGRGLTRVIGIDLRLASGWTLSYALVAPALARALVFPVDGRPVGVPLAHTHCRGLVDWIMANGTPESAETVPEGCVAAILAAYRDSPRRR